MTVRLSKFNTPILEVIKATKKSLFELWCSNKISFTTKKDNRKLIDKDY